MGSLFEPSAVHEVGAKRRPDVFVDAEGANMLARDLSHRPEADVPVDAEGANMLARDLSHRPEADVPVDAEGANIQT